MKFLSGKRPGYSLLECAIILAILAAAFAVFIPTSIHLTHQTRINAVETQLRDMAYKARTEIVDKGLRRTTYANLVRDGVFPPAEPILGETYDHLIFEHVGGVVFVDTKDGEKVFVRY